MKLGHAVRVVAVVVAALVFGAGEATGQGASVSSPSPRPADTYLSVVEEVGSEPWTIACETEPASTMRMMYVVDFQHEHGWQTSLGRAEGGTWVSGSAGATAAGNGVVVRTPESGTGSGWFTFTSDGSEPGLLRLAIASWGAPLACTHTVGDQQRTLTPGPSSEAHIAEVSDFGGGAGVHASSGVGLNAGALLSAELSHDGELYAVLGDNSTFTPGAGLATITDPAGHAYEGIGAATVWGATVPGTWRYEINMVNAGILPGTILWAIELPLAA